MYPQQAGHMSRPPFSPQPTHIPLSLRTTITSTQNAPQQHEQSSSSTSPPPSQQQGPSSRPYPSYPLSISPEKFSKASKLYNKYYLEKGLSQRLREPQSAIEPTSLLNIPNARRAHSLSSPGSSRGYSPSVSSSAFDGVTETVVSFTGDESPGSATPNGSTNLISFNGERVRQRVRRPLTPVTKAKAALIRHLVSCWVCHSRRVPCPLEHHDIDSLERARQAKVRTRQRALSVQEQSLPSNASSCNTASGSKDQPRAGGSQRQMTSLLGVGGVGQADQFQDIPPTDATHADPQSSTYAPETDFLAGIPTHSAVAGPSNVNMRNMTYDRYAAAYPNGHIFPLGVLRGFFYTCAHLDGCVHPFEDVEALQIHFETHFSYNRIANPHRYLCSYCESPYESPSVLCLNCGSEGPFETWIYGKYIRVPTYQRHGPDGQDFLRNNSSTPYFASTGGYGNGVFDFGLRSMDNGNGNSTTGGMNQGGGYNFQNHNSGNPGSQGDNDGYTTPRSGGFPQGNWTRRRAAKVSPVTARYWYAGHRHQTLLLLTLLLLVALTLLLKAHEWVLNKARSFTTILQNTDLPAIGFVGFLASFTVCYGAWSAGKAGEKRAGSAQSRLHRCPVHDLPTCSLHYRQTARITFIRGKDLFS